MMSVITPKKCHKLTTVTSRSQIHSNCQVRRNGEIPFLHQCRIPSLRHYLSLLLIRYILEVCKDKGGWKRPCKFPPTSPLGRICSFDSFASWNICDPYLLLPTQALRKSVWVLLLDDDNLKRYSLYYWSYVWYLWGIVLGFQVFF